MDRNPEFLKNAGVVKHLQITICNNSQMGLKDNKMNKSNATIMSVWTVLGLFIYCIVVWQQKQILATSTPDVNANSYY